MYTTSRVIITDMPYSNLDIEKMQRIPALHLFKTPIEPYFFFPSLT